MQDPDMSNLKRKATKFPNKNCGCRLAFEAWQFEKEISDMREKLRKMKEDDEGMSHKLQNDMEKLGKVSIRNFNEKLRRRNEMYLKLTEKPKQQEGKERAFARR